MHFDVQDRSRILPGGSADSPSLSSLRISKVWALTSASEAVAIQSAVRPPQVQQWQVHTSWVQSWVVLVRAYLFTNDPAHARPWNPAWVTHRVGQAPDAAGVEFDIKGGGHYTAGQFPVGGFDVRNTAARLGHSGGGGAAALRRPGSRDRPARRRLPRAVNRRIRNSERLSSRSARLAPASSSQTTGGPGRLAIGPS